MARVKKTDFFERFTAASRASGPTRQSIPPCGAGKQVEPGAFPVGREPGSAAATICPLPHPPAPHRHGGRLDLARFSEPMGAAGDTLDGEAAPRPVVAEH